MVERQWLQHALLSIDWELKYILTGTALGKESGLPVKSKRNTRRK